MDQKDELRTYLEEKLEEHEQKNPEDNKHLMGALMEWGSVVQIQGTLYDAIKSQVEYQAQRRNTSPKKFIDYLFRQENCDTWMLAFQL